MVWINSLYIKEKIPGLEKYLSYNSSTFKQHCKKIIKDRYILWWKKNASVYSKNGKLRCYLLFKCNFGLENYLSIVRCFEHRKNITKLRISAHKLKIEVGRYQGTLLQNRVCHRCNTGEIDDEIHYLFKCVKFTQEKAELNEQITLIYQNINNLDDNNRLLWILNNENSIILKALCQYMIKTGFK